MNQIAIEEEWMRLEEEEESNVNPRKKLRLTKEQSRLLEESFRKNHTLNPVCYSPKSFFLCHARSILTMFIRDAIFIQYTEAERVFGNAAETPTKTSGGVVSKP